MKRKCLQPLTPAALHARVSSDRQDDDLSVANAERYTPLFELGSGSSIAA